MGLTGLHLTGLVPSEVTFFGNIFLLNMFFFPISFRKRKMSGFGHRVYKNYDPRAKVIRKLADEVFSIVGRDPLIEVFF